MNGENIFEKQSSFRRVAYMHGVKTGNPWASILKNLSKALGSNTKVLSPHCSKILSGKWFWGLCDALRYLEK